MSEEPIMKLYLFAVAAIHAGAEGEQSGISIRSALGLIPEGADIKDAGMQVAKSLFPEANGWVNHFAHADEMPPEIPLDPYRLIWHYEKVG